ncbi:MAG TPA: GWxTD domain-containing protein [Gemmatimonadales bacterium]|nr:GWxTD domain-containing protein [Gemmatimonadales bacterium]
MRRRVLPLAVIFSTAGGCGSWQRVGSPDASPRPGTTVPRLFDATSVYRSMGAFVGGGALPFVASIRYLAGPTPDSTLALFSVSLTNQTLTFQRRAGEFVAEYHVEASFRTDSIGLAPVRQIGSDEQVRVRNFQETLRNDESIIFQQFVTVPPGVYHVLVLVRDRNGPAFARAERADTAPRFTASSMTRPIAVYTAEGRAQRSEVPKLVANPRATLPYGIDSLRFYIESYGTGTSRIVARVVDGADHELWRDSVTLSAGTDLARATVLVVPGKLPVGQAELQAVPLSGGDTTRSRFLVSFSNQWVITNFEEMTSLLRYFERQDWVDSLRRSAPDHRPEVWRAFWKATDPSPITPENEAIDDYFRRIQQANVRFQDEGEPGWLTERGEVFITLGEPDEILDLSNGMDRSGQRVLRWTYTSQRLVLYFQDQTGFGRYRLTPSSRAEFQRVLARVRRSER